MNVRASQAALLLIAGLAGGAGIQTACAATAGTETQLLPFEASYALRYKGLNAATTTLSLTRLEGERWSYRSRGEARGIFRALPIDNPAQDSEFELGTLGLRPLHFSQSNGGDAAHAVDLRFDWTTSRVSGTVERKAVDEAVPADTQDDLSIQIALIRAMASGATSGTFHTYGDRGLRESRWRAGGEETLHTALGDVATREFVTERSGSPRVTRYWCAPAYGFLPLRVEQKRLDAVEWTLEIQNLKRDSR